ncbi:MAG: serine/threonine protein kinase [Gammaproteobacteria bacterium]|jgi:serine/threonine protein kinase
MHSHVNQLPLIDGRFQRLRALTPTGTTTTYDAENANGEPVRVIEFFPVDVASRAADGTIQARHDTQALFARAVQAYAHGAQAIRSLKHSGVITPHEVIQAHGTVYLICSTHEVRSVAARVSAEQMSGNDVLRLSALALRILDDVHASGFVHGNLTPDTVLLDDDHNVLIEHFGQWRAALGQEIRHFPSAFTSGSTAIETLYPERFESGPWTDVYGLASVLFYALYARPSADCLTRQQIVNATDIDPGPGKPKSTAHRTLTNAIAAGLALSPEQRPPTPSQWRAAFAPPGPTSQAPSPITSEQQTQRAGSSPTVRRSTRKISSVVANAAGIAAVVLLAGVATVGIGSRVMYSAEPTPPLAVEESPPARGDGDDAVEQMLPGTNAAGAGHMTVTPAARVSTPHVAPTFEELSVEGKRRRKALALGTFVVEIDTPGTALALRPEYERLKAGSSALSIWIEARDSVASTASNAYRLVRGPFDSQEQAEVAAQALGKLLPKSFSHQVIEANAHERRL